MSSDGNFYSCHHGNGAHRLPRQWLVLLVIACAPVLAGCGIGANAAPNHIAKSQVPYGLLRKSPPTPSTGVDGGFVTIYLAVPQRLVAVSATVPFPVSIEGALNELGQGPTSKEAANGLESPISTAAPLNILRVTTGVATIDVGSSFSTLGGSNQILAAAQVVFTVTAFPGVGAVKFRIGGHTASVPTGRGTLTTSPLTRTDYSGVAPI